MPDRYGDEPDVERIADYHSIDACDLCDDNGYIGSTVCDHYDHAAAAKRGMANPRGDGMDDTMTALKVAQRCAQPQQWASVRRQWER